MEEETQQNSVENEPVVETPTVQTPDVETPVVETPVIESEEAEEMVMDEPVSEAPVDPQHDIKPIIVDGLQVVSILEDGRETETHYHCQMSNGTTMHVAKELFLAE